MHTFTDCSGRLWEVSVNLATIEDVRARAQIDLLDLTDGQLFIRLASDPFLLAQTLFALCHDQAEREGIALRGFKAALAGDAIADATDALLEDLADFFPRQRRVLLKRALAELPKAETAAMRKAEAELEAALRQPSNCETPSGGSPAPSASTPPPGPSDSSSAPTED